MFLELLPCTLVASLTCIIVCRIDAKTEQLFYKIILHVKVIVSECCV